MCVPHAPQLGMGPSHQTSSPFQFWPALQLSCSPNCCCPPGARRKLSTCPGWDHKRLNTGQCQGWAWGAPHSPGLQRTIFQGLPELLSFGWIKEGRWQSLCFQWSTCLCAWRSMVVGMAGSTVMLMLSLRHPNSGCFSVPEKGTSTEKQKTAN